MRATHVASLREDSELFHVQITIHPVCRLRVPAWQSMELLAPTLVWIKDVLLALSPVDVTCILVAMLIIRVSRYAGMWIYALMALPGTVAHELAHFIVAWILGAQPSFPALVPTRTQHGWQLGSVAFRVGHVRAVPIALAPLVLAPLALWWAGWFLHGATLPLYGLHIWMIAALLTASLPSKTDVKLALPALTILLVVGLVLCAIWWRTN
jgi:hypothetical protein